MKYYGTIIGVFYEHDTWVDEWFKSVVEEKQMFCACRYDNSRRILALGDGTLFVAININDNVKGRRFDKAYIESTIDDDVINKVIMPMLSLPRLIIG